MSHDHTPAELNVVLRTLASGDLHVLSMPAAFAPEQAQQRFSSFGPSLHGLVYIVVVGRDGQPLASSESAGVAFAPPERLEWYALAQVALGDARDPRQLVAVRSGDGPAVLGAYPVVDERGRHIAAVVVATRDVPAPNGAGDLWQELAIFSAVSLAVLAAASVFALVSSGLVGYLLSRRLVSRLERLGRAAESLASGDLSRRVEEGRPDEVGQLARQFNHMAERLANSVADLETEKHHAEAALRAKRELVANVSHELRTPLSLIRSHVESLLMQDDADGGRQREYLPIVHRETEHLSRLIDDLFTLSTAETGALPLRLEPVLLGEVVEEVVCSIGPVARGERRVTIVASAPSGLPPALADRQRVVQILGNLVRNALRHTPEGGADCGADRGAGRPRVSGSGGHRGGHFL